ncbi:MAG: porin family protein [bacterium]
MKSTSARRVPAVVLLVAACLVLAAMPLRVAAAEADRAEIKAAFDGGMAACAQGDYAKAAAEFERVLALDPMHHRARLELGRTYYAQGRLDEAQREFETVLSYNPPETVQKNIHIFLDRIEREGKRFNVSLRLSAGVLYDDNVNIGPSSDLINIRPTSFGGATLDALTVSPDSQPQDSWGEFVEGAVYMQYDAGAKGDWLLVSGADYYETWLDDHTDREVLYADVYAGPTRVRKDNVLNLPVRFAHIDQGSDSLVDILGVAPAYVVAVRDDLISSSGLTAEQRNYTDFDERDSVYTELREQVTRLYDNKNKSVAATIGVFYEDADSDVNSNVGLLAALAGSLDLPWKSRLDVRGGYRGSWYDDPDPIAPEDREDHELQGLVQLSRQISKDWGIGLLYQFTNRDSTFDLYEYERNFVNVHVNFTM